MFKPRDYALGIQHLLAMFGATVLVPLITGLSPSVALFTAGIGTLAFHCVTKMKVPVFLGSSFAFIPCLCAVIKNNPENIPYAQCGVIAAGLVYLAFALIAKIVGPHNIRKIFPPIVTGPVIVVIGLTLTGVGVKDALNYWGDGAAFTWQTMYNACIAIFCFIVVVWGMNTRFKTFKLVPILSGIILGYLLCLCLNIFGLYDMNLEAIKNAPWLNVPYSNGFLTMPKWDISAVLMIAPIALVTFMEHIGDITTNGAVVGQDFFKDPGLHRTLSGDGIATIVAGFFGGPANTTYSENTGVLATTGNYNPALLRLAALFAILLGLIGKFGAILLTIPCPVKGGIELVLFGMIASVGVRSIAEAKLDLTNSRNLVIMGSVLCTGIGLGSIGGVPLVFGDISVTISALFVATVIGVVMNLIIPEKKND